MNKIIIIDDDKLDLILLLNELNKYKNKMGLEIECYTNPLNIKMLDEKM